MTLTKYMKQHITEEQLNELDTKNRRELIGWFEAKEWFPHYSIPQMMLETFDKTLSDTIGIGQMIEFLIENKQFVYDSHRDTTGIGELKIVRVNPQLDNVCDALWEAVKEVLLQKNVIKDWMRHKASSTERFNKILEKE